MPLKTDYKDWVPSWNGMQYDIGPTSQGHSSITDVTVYSQIGDEWKAEIINATNVDVNQLMWRMNNYRDPITGLVGTIETALNSLYNLHRDNALLCDEYDDLGLLCNEYDEHELLANQYDMNGKTLLV